MWPIPVLSTQPAGTLTYEIHYALAVGTAREGTPRCHSGAIFPSQWVSLRVTGCHRPLILGRTGIYWDVVEQPVWV